MYPYTQYSTMAATKNQITKTEERTNLRPIDVALSLPKQKWIVKALHKIIANATTPMALGFSYNTRVVVGNGTGRYWDTNHDNWMRTQKFKAYDEGVYCHLLNKVAKLIRNGDVECRDYLAIMDYRDYEPWVNWQMMTFDEDGEVLDTDAVQNAHKMYGHTLRGDMD